MELPKYVTPEEVKRVCKELGLTDWSELSEPAISQKEASVVLKAVNSQKMDIPIESFRQGLEVELEHGKQFDDANVTNNHPLLTGMIVLAHLKETMDYYERLDVAEVEGDLLKAIAEQDLKKIKAKYKKLIVARNKLNEAEARRLL